MRGLFKRILFFSFLFPLLFFALCIGCSAEEALAQGQELPEEFLLLMEGLPKELRERLPEEIFTTDPSQLGAAVEKISSFSYLVQTVLDLLGLHLGDAVRLLAILAGMLLLCAVFRCFQDAIARGGMRRAFSFLLGAIMLIFLLKEGYRALASVSDYLASLNAITASSIPLMGTLYAMGGNLSTAVASSAGLTLFMSLLEGFVGRTVIPFCGICLSLVCVGSLDPALRTGSLVGTLKRNYTTALGFLMTLLVAMLSSQTLLGARADSLAMRGAKFAAGNMIPVVGGSVSELLKTVSASIGYLRATVGICTLLLLLFLLLPPLTELFLLRLVWQIGASLADLLGCEGEKKLLEEFASLNGYLIAAVCICSSVLFLALSLFLHCASAIA